MKRGTPKIKAIDRMASDCIAVRVRMINRVVSAIYDDALRPFGIRVTQGNILVAIARNSGARPGEICRLLRVEKSTLSREIEILKRKGWVESHAPEGPWIQRLRITDEGLNLLARCQPAWESAQAEAQRLIGGPGVDALNAIAERLGPEAPEG